MNYQTSSKQDLWKLVKKLQKQVEQKNTEIAELREQQNHKVKVYHAYDAEIAELSAEVEKQSDEISNLLHDIGLFQKQEKEQAAEIAECIKLLQQLKDSNTELNKELDEVKEEAALLRKYEEVAERKLEQARSQCREWRYKNSEYADQIVEARRLTWELYDFLIKEEAKGLEIELDDVRAIIEQLHE